ncbi:hypothetical protein [Desulfoluna spongiiphila]|uniref:Porin n=1 Tax=Desulfoluna spongiiphila TaxID=419481 RepID=A0A1G5JHK3_9BACT|nr:hypothetical protein [Desulfoluna spongiiphila]SCY87370.1 hypothetical protein SAMN05216233_13037 [Desulfoluna spongiiphila]
MMKRTAILFSFILVFLSAQSAGAFELGSEGQVTIHGFITQGYLLSSDNKFFGDTDNGGTYHFNERGINFTSDVSDRLRLGIQFFSRDFGSLGENEVTIDWAYADYSFTEWANFKAGKLKMPQGLYNTSRDVDMLRTSVLLPQSVYNEGWRDSINALNGFEYYGYAPAGKVGSFEYHLMGGVNQFDDDGPEMRLLEDQFPIYLGVDVSNNEVDRTYVGSVLWETPLDGLSFGVSGWEMNFNADITSNPDGSVTSPPAPTLKPSEIEVTQTGWTTSLQYAVGDFVFSTEYNRINYEMVAPGYIPEDSAAADFDSEGYYGMITYRFTDWFELGTYYSEYYANRDDKDGEKSAQKWALSDGLLGGYPPRPGAPRLP